FAMREHMDLPWFFPVYRALLQPARDAATAVPRYTWPFKRETREQRPVRDPFRGEAVILVNGRSFSVTSEFAAIARSSGRARVVGEETGGGYSGNTSGFFAITRLPNSRLIVGIPLWGYYLAVEPIQPLDRGVIPTVTVVPEIGDIMAGRDPVVSAALALPRDP
ncbi:MAG: S41 family peptidase, partial [Spirochaetota bacterium]